MSANCLAVAISLSFQHSAQPVPPLQLVDVYLSLAQPLSIFGSF